MIISLMVKNMSNKFPFFSTFTLYNYLIAFIIIVHFGSIIAIWILSLKHFFERSQDMKKQVALRFILLK